MSDEARNFRLSKDVLPSKYELRFELEFDNWTSTGWERITLRTARLAREIVLHSLDLDIAKATLDGEVAQATTYDTDAETATLRFGREIPAGEHILEISWTGGIRESLRGLYRSLRGEERYAATQFEAADARRAFPCFDEPEFKARFAVDARVHPAGNAAIANGAIVAQEAARERPQADRFRETPPISSYLVAFTVGPYEVTDVVTTPSGSRCGSGCRPASRARASTRATRTCAPSSGSQTTPRSPTRTTRSTRSASPTSRPARWRIRAPSPIA